MDKNMIKIDDLLRQRLDGAEEQERAGAWSNMSALLDKQMPVSKVPAGTNWRRMFAYVAGVVLLAAVSVGGYEMAESFSSDGNIAENNNTPRNNAVPTSGLAGTAVNSLPDDTRHNETEEAIAAPATDVANNTVTATKKVVSNNVTTSAQPDNSIKPNSNIAKTVAKKLNANTSAPATASNGSEQKAVEVTKVASPALANSKTASKIATASKQNASTTVVETKQAANTNVTTAHNAPVNNNKQDIRKAANANDAKTSFNNKHQDAPTSLSASAPHIAKTSAADPEPKFKEVPYQKTVRRESIGPDGKPQMDTIFNGEDVMKVRIEDDNKLAANKSDDENSGSNIMPAAAAPSTQSESNVEDANMQKLGDHKVSSKKMKNFNPSRFEEMVKNAKFRMGTVKFYPGVVAGANMSFGGNAGFHVGAAGNLTVSERWAILAEVKFAYTFNNSKENLQDDFIDNVEPTVVNGQAVYKYDSIDHHFNFNSYNSLEVPLMLTYTKNRVVFLAGAAFRYNFAISSLQEVEQKYLSEKKYYSTSDPQFESEQKILLSDFAPTINISPIIGAGYQFTPAFRLDCRLSQPIWNNGKTLGQKEIAKGLYNKAQLQLNMTWKIASKKPYKRK